MHAWANALTDALTQLVEVADAPAMLSQTGMFRAGSKTEFQALPQLPGAEHQALTCIQIKNEIEHTFKLIRPSAEQHLQRTGSTQLTRPSGVEAKTGLTAVSRGNHHDAVDIAAFQRFPLLVRAKRATNRGLCAQFRQGLSRNAGE